MGREIIVSFISCGKVVDVDDEEKPFSNVGPYRVQIDSSEISIRGASFVAETTVAEDESANATRR
jgi:hypothetical protein